MGRTAEASSTLEELERLGRTEQMSPWHGAVIHLGLGEHTRALDLLDLAFEQQSWQIPLLPVEPIFRPAAVEPPVRRARRQDPPLTVAPSPSRCALCRARPAGRRRDDATQEA
jgi:hypothetical protein